MRPGPVRWRPVALAAGVAGAAALAAAAVLGSPLLAIGVAAGLAVAVLLVLHPWAAVAVLVAVEASNVSTVVGRHAGLSLYLVALAAAVGALAVGLLRGTVRLAWSPVFLFFGLYVAARGLSVFAAGDPGLGTAALAEDAKRLVYLVVVTILLASVGGLTRVAMVLVAVIALLAGLSMVQEFALDNSTTFGGLSQVPIGEDLGGTTARHSGPYGEADVVGWGKAQVLFLPLALSLCADRRAGRQRWLWFAAALAIAGGIYLTQSRGAYLALGFAVVVWLLVAGRPYARLLRFAPLALLLALFIPGVGSRLATLAALQEARTGGGGDVSLVERVAVQRDALSMFAQHPSLGVGPGNFLAAQPDFQRESGLIDARPLLVHNSYLQVAAESGLVGLAAWLLFYGCAVFVACRALILFGRLSGVVAHAGRGRWLAAGVLGGLAGFALATLFVPLNQVRTLLSVVALGAALDIRARWAAGPRPAGTEPPSSSDTGAPPRRPGFVPVAGAAAVFGVLLAAGAALLPLRGQAVWVHEATAQVVPRVQDRSAAAAYEYDLLSRGTLVPTYAAVLADPGFQREAIGTDTAGRAPADVAWVRVTSAPATALITVSAGGTEAAVARRTAREVLARGSAFVAALKGQYVLVPVDAPATTATRRGPMLPARVAALLGACAAAAVATYWILRARQRRRPAPGNVHNG